MKLLSDLLYKVRIEEVKGNTNLSVASMCFDSREAKQNSIFIATRGHAFNGHSFISKAIHNGSIVIVCECFPDEFDQGITYVKVKKSSRALGVIASNFYDNPSEKIKLIGVTGTNGKTTIVSLLHQLFLLLLHHLN